MTIASKFDICESTTSLGDDLILARRDATKVDEPAQIALLELVRRCRGLQQMREASQCQQHGYM
eukprot:580340-Amphidinium_carterae.1